jgi:ferredoxin-NADP reductase
VTDPAAGGLAGAGPGAAPVRPGAWQQATVVEVRRETATAKTFRLALAQPIPHMAGQHLIVRLTAPDGYTASRSYSIASAPLDPAVVELTVELLPEGEVSGYLHEVVEPGDTLEVRGPIGGWFVWPGDTPALLVGGGSGVVPLMAMLRLARATGRADLVALAVSVRRPGDLYYAAELPGPEVTVAYSREAPPGEARSPGRLAVGDLAPLVRPDATAYLCGSAGFTAHAGGLLEVTGVPADRIRVERFGPTG